MAQAEIYGLGGEIYSIRAANLFRLTDAIQNLRSFGCQLLICTFH